LPLLAGRAFNDSDTAATQHVAIVNQSFVRRFFHGANPIGRILNKNIRIVGVVADVTVAPGLNDDDPPLTHEETVYVPAAQADAKLLALVHIWFQPSWIVRSSNMSSDLTAQMQRTLATTAPSLAISGFYRMNDLLAHTLATQRIEVALLSVMAALALSLSAIGISALVANLVLQRTREIGIRIALGSTIRQAMLHIGSSGLIASTVGLLAGLGLSAAALRALHSVLYGVGIYDPATLAAVIATLAVVTLLATTIPTLRITRIDPARTLHEE